MELKELIETHRKSVEETMQTRNKIYREISSYIEKTIPKEDINNTENISKKIDEHYKFRVPLEYLFGAIEYLTKD